VSLLGIAVESQQFGVVIRTLELVNPQPNVARILVLLGIDQVLTVRSQPDSGTAGARMQEG
jgi:anti-anti-sigma regulatory factor